MVASRSVGHKHVHQHPTPVVLAFGNHVSLEEIRMALVFMTGRPARHAAHLHGYFLVNRITSMGIAKAINKAQATMIATMTPDEAPYCVR